mgnify:CR=1 FL=1
MDNKYVKIPISVLMDKSISPNAKLLYGVIVVLSYVRDYCFADNTYLAETLNTTNRTITRLIKELKDSNYIYITNEKHKRKIYIKDVSTSSIDIEDLF